mmetsp:Transcript_9728/g.17498  ORF Transcript_9728/g.17498 Transcript_9728/m.17498 type:complete len:425 (-) Transcript_9728:136-1410(-)|eukprot:CAMPEP_0201999554 /NCGR_PEP_ID=MMETSP0905-20130828/6117_1 /ASSEMBLY_ACC=CAM_ASM_000554 /TAXON_ID=420261 /ORGANISM="Thalassiosira antarctica, Strain CCMP982" /LENGTH=424 /DNA_ID=CAMNT_0048555823 /DNA_START=61 /DNA_END=1335 /DNA_ORIENTATION=-
MGASEIPSKEEEELLARLQAQFGDMDVGGMLGDQCNCDDDDSESSLEEPTAEELRVWQEMQYDKGRMKMEAKRIQESGSVGNSALQRRRQKKTAQQRTLMREYEETEEANEWEHLAPTPDLGRATSIFFPAVLENDADCAGAGDLELAGGVNPLLQKLVKGDPEVLGTKWSPLYSSSEGDGLSFYNLLDKIRGYDGPTVLLLGGTPSPSRCLGQVNHDDRVSLGFFTTDSWIESSDHFGSSDDCFLFSLDHKTNDVKFIRPKARSQSSPNLGTKRYMYCHPSSLSTTNRRIRGASKTDGSVHGIGIGGSASLPRMHITESLEECRALAWDSLFDDGDLLSEECSKSLYYFDVDCIEVWGVGGEEWISDALKARAKGKESQIASLEQARKVDKSQFLGDFENELTCGNKPGLFGHRGLVEERCDL